MRRVLPLVLTPVVLAAAAVGAWHVSRTPDAEPQMTLVAPATPAIEGLPVDVSAFPIMYERAPFRMNVSLVTAPLPLEVWSSSAFRNVLAVDETSGTFPVRVWRIRDGNTEQITTLRLPAAGARLFQFAVGAEFQKGDVLAVEYVPGLLVADGWPIASLIDNVSGDPTTLPGVRSRIVLPFASSRPKRRAVQS